MGTGNMHMALQNEQKKAGKGGLAVAWRTTLWAMKPSDKSENSAKGASLLCAAEKDGCAKPGHRGIPGWMECVRSIYRACISVDVKRVWKSLLTSTAAGDPTRRRAASAIMPLKMATVSNERSRMLRAVGEANILGASPPLESQCTRPTADL